MTFSTSSFCQWNTNLLVNTPLIHEEPQNLTAAQNVEGETYTVYWKGVPEPVNMELRMQIVDAFGFPKLGTNGVLISNQIPMVNTTLTS